MRIPPYWFCERRKVNGRYVRRYYLSEHSVEDARRHRIPAAQCVERADSYHTPIYEPLLAQADEQNIVTRNHYGCRVLNTTSVCFADVDRVPDSFLNTLKRLFGGGLSDEERLLRCIRLACAADASLGVRIYRTAHGWRLVLAGQGISLQSPRMAELFAAFHVDPRYARMCRLQQCWRARLSPKPFHRGLKRFPFPLHSDWESDPAAISWIRAYEHATTGLAVCCLIAEMGQTIHDPVVNWHDEVTLALHPDKKLG